MTHTITQQTADCFRRFNATVRPPQLRTIQEFAEQEIILPNGPFEGFPFRCDRQPYTALLFALLMSQAWNRFFITGPTQSGKTLAAFVIPLLYHLFERGESIICGVPNKDMVGDKWRDDLRPVIERTRYRDLMPTEGPGSRDGGTPTSITFQNGVEIRFMTGGGGDKGRAGKTVPVLFVTETDGFDIAGGTSHESDKFSQLEGRLRAMRGRSRVIAECTTTIVTGRTWREIKAGTDTRIVLPCPHCRNWVSPEREHLLGWQDAKTETEAATGAYWGCPSCGEAWAEADRTDANRASRVLHRGQTITEAGEVVGPLPETKTLGFRYSAVQNEFLLAEDHAVDEFKKDQDGDPENAERMLCQQVWALPYKPPEWEEAPLTVTGLLTRRAGLTLGILPADTTRMALGLDVHQHFIYYLLLAETAAGPIPLVDFGILDVHSDNLKTEAAILASLREFRDGRLATGWTVQVHGNQKQPDAVWSDSGWKPDPVFAFCRESNQAAGSNCYLPILGRGESVYRSRRYERPTKTGTVVRYVGTGWHLSRVPARANAWQVTLDSDANKIGVQTALALPEDTPGAIVLPNESRQRLQKLSHHLTSEKLVRKMEPGKGETWAWDKHGANHWLDAAAYAFAALTFLREIAAKPTATQPTKRTIGPEFRMPGDRPFLTL